MSRTNRADLEYSDYIGARPAVSQLGVTGLSISRGFDVNLLADAHQLLAEQFPEALIRETSRSLEKPPAVNLLEANEVKRQKNIGNIAVQDAVDKLYDEVYSLRQNIPAAPSRILFLGRAASRNQVMTVVFDAGTEEALVAERKEILDSLEGMAEVEYEYSWIRKKIPHITLARLGLNQVAVVGPKTRKEIMRSLPESIVLNKASFS
ncbi:MAG: hypothetical protein WD877_02725 [Candidatus Saccharimonadales bacterium]